MNPHRYAFIEFRDADAAAYALNKLNEHPVDTFLVNRFPDIEDFADLDGTYVEPRRVPHQGALLAFPETVWIDEVIEQFEEVVESNYGSITMRRSRGTHLRSSSAHTYPRSCPFPTP